MKPRDSTQGKSEDEVPDGGLQAWLQVLGSSFVWLNTLGLFASYGEFQSFYTLEKLPDKSPLAIAWIGSTQASLFFFVSILSGPLYDMGYFKHLLPAGSVLIVFGMMMASICDELWQLVLAQGLCVGIGCGLVFVPTIGVVMQWFSSKRALANGLGSIGSGIGGIIYPVMFRRLQPAVGFGWAVRIIGFVMLATQVFAILLLRMRQEPQRTRTLIDPAAFTNVSFVILFPVAVLSLAAIYIPFFYISSYAIQDHLTDPDLGFYLIAILNAASIPGRIVPAALADKQTGLVNMSIIVQLVTGVLVFAWAGVHDRAGVIVLAIFFGFFGGATLSLFALLPIPFVPDERLLGTRMGMIYVFAGIGILFGSPVAGALVQHTTSYTRLQVFTGVLLLGGGFLTCLARLIHTKWRILVKF